MGCGVGTVLALVKVLALATTDVGEGQVRAKHYLNVCVCLQSV